MASNFNGLAVWPDAQNGLYFANVTMPFSRITRAQAYPTRPVRWLVGLAAGGPADIVARLMAQWLSEQLGRQFVVENRPGAGSNIATDAVVRSAPDGYTRHCHVEVFYLEIGEILETRG